MELHVAKPPVTWVLVADAEQAQIYTPQRVEKRIPMAGNGKHTHFEEKHERELVPILVKPLSGESAREYEVGRHKTGTVFESFSSARHTAEPRLDVHKEIRQHFAQRIADMLNGAKMGEAFDRLVLVAPPEMLGEIDARLDEKIRRKVTHKVAKELVRYSNGVLMGHLEQYL